MLEHTEFNFVKLFKCNLFFYFCWNKTWKCLLFYKEIYRKGKCFIFIGIIKFLEFLPILTPKIMKWTIFSKIFLNQLLPLGPPSMFLSQKIRNNLIFERIYDPVISIIHILNAGANSPNCSFVSCLGSYIACQLGACIVQKRLEKKKKKFNVHLQHQA